MMDHNPDASGDEKVTRLLGALAPDPADRPNPHQALNQFKLRIKEEGKDGYTMFGLKLSPKIQRTLAAGLTVAALAGLLAVPQVRAFASGVLSMFRVQRFVMVPVSEERIEQIQAAMENNAGFGESETIKEGGEPQEVASMDEAASVAGFSPLVADPSYGDPNEIQVSQESVVRYRPDVAAMRDVFTALNVDPELIPANIDGQPFDITIPGGIMSTYGKKKNAIGFMQVPSPTVEVPEGVDMQKLGEAMLQLLGMSPEEAARMSASIDWTSTLVVPVPNDLNSMREVNVRGTTGLLYEGKAGQATSDKAPEYTISLVWENDGYLYGVMGNNVTRVLAFADGLR